MAQQVIREMRRAVDFMIYPRCAEFVAKTKCKDGAKNGEMPAKPLYE
jgi:hypothetical protein